MWNPTGPSISSSHFWAATPWARPVLILPNSRSIHPSLARISSAPAWEYGGRWCWGPHSAQACGPPALPCPTDPVILPEKAIRLLKHHRPWDTCWLIPIDFLSFTFGNRCQGTRSMVVPELRWGWPALCFESSSFPFLKSRAMSLFSSHSPLLTTTIFHRWYTTAHSHIDQPFWHPLWVPTSPQTGTNPVPPSSSQPAVLSLWAVPFPTACTLTLPAKTGKTWLKSKQSERGLSHLIYWRFGKFMLCWR